MIASTRPFNWLWDWWLPWIEAMQPMAHAAPVTGEAAPRLAAIHAGAFARPWGAIEFERLLADRTVLADGVFVGAAPEPVGFALSRRVLDEAEILTIAVLPQAQGRGRARTLLRHHLDTLARHGVRRVHLEVAETNAPALALYRRFGFRETGRREGYYAKSGGVRAAALTMTLDL